MKLFMSLYQDLTDAVMSSLLDGWQIGKNNAGYGVISRIILMKGDKQKAITLHKEHMRSDDTNWKSCDMVYLEENNEKYRNDMFFGGKRNVIGSYYKIEGSPVLYETEVEFQAVLDLINKRIELRRTKTKLKCTKRHIELAWKLVYKQGRNIARKDGRVRKDRVIGLEFRTDGNMYVVFTNDYGNNCYEKLYRRNQ